MKKLKLVLLLLVIFPLGLDGISQTVNQAELHGTPTISGIKYDRSYLNEHTSVDFRFDIGVSYMRLLKPKFRIGTGITYSRMGYNTSYSNHGNLNQGNPINLEQNIYKCFIELPIKFSSQIGNNAVHSFFFDVNLINQLLICTFTESNYGIYYDKVSFKELKDNNRSVYNVAFQIGATYQKSFTNNLYFGLAPFFKIGILYSNDWSAGLKVAMGFNF